MPKKAVDANKPRGPVSAYTLFVRTCRDELRRKYPQLTVDYSVISKKCSERWKIANETEKKRFNETADIHRKRYKEELATYQQEQLAKQQSATSSILLQTPATQYLLEPSLPQQQQHPLMMSTPIQHTMMNPPKKVVKKRERKPKDPLAPKKPLSAYFLFCADERPKVHGCQTGNSNRFSSDEKIFLLKKISFHYLIKFNIAVKHFYLIVYLTVSRFSFSLHLPQYNKFKR